LPRAYGELKKELEEELVRLGDEIRELGSREEERPGYGNHMADDATGVFEQTRNLSLRASLEERVRTVQEALARFETGNYGTCEDCGRTIEWGRLKTLPYTRHCVECVRRHERNQ
jgi:DnaK suppressor protein